jgi:hypothetical protein
MGASWNEVEHFRQSRCTLSHKGRGQITQAAKLRPNIMSSVKRQAHGRHGEDSNKTGKGTGG